MSNVIQFVVQKSEDQVWQCSCGNQLFYIIDDEYVQCSECDVAHPIECKLVEKSETSDDG